MIVTLLTGCNLGDKERNMTEVISLIEQSIGTVILKSSLYHSEAWGFESKDEFLNQIIVCRTQLSPEDTLLAIWDIERHFGKERGSKEEEIEKFKLRQSGKMGYQSRNMDIDIIFYDDIIVKTPLLTIPHPMYKLRKFVLEPLNEVMSDYKPTGEQLTINEMFLNLD